MGTRIIAPAQVASSLWNVEAIPAGRLVAPLAIIDVTAETRDRSDYQVSVADIARWEQTNGEIPLGSVVMVRTGWKSSEKNSLEFSQDAALFLVDGRKVVGLGTDAPVAHENDELSEADRYALSHSAYELDNVANLYGVPDHGAVVLVAPTKVEGRASAPVRVMALVR
jgi:kynurenine formamidase